MVLFNLVLILASPFLALWLTALSVMSSGSLERIWNGIFVYFLCLFGYFFLVGLSWWIPMPLRYQCGPTATKVSYAFHVFVSLMTTFVALMITGIVVLQFVLETPPGLKFLMLAPVVFFWIAMFICFLLSDRFEKYWNEKHPPKPLTEKQKRSLDILDVLRWFFFW